MQEFIKVDFHSHSAFSDGGWRPEQIAQACAEQGVRYAALTDHCTLEGLDRFEAACARLGVGFLNGLELTAFYDKKEIHLLCYGFDRTHIALIRMVKAVRESLVLKSAPFALFEKKSLLALIKTVHQAGGVVLLAHPLATESDFGRMESLVAELARAGLDGIEVDHPTASDAQRTRLREYATRLDLVVSGGSDHHGRADEKAAALGVELPARDWMALRDRLVSQRKQAQRDDESTAPHSGLESPGEKKTGRMRLLASMALPAISVVVLFTLALFGYFLPGYENTLMERKREMIRELTRTVWSLLDEADKNVQAGRVSPEDARSQVIDRVRALRYGREGKDYFWLQDLTPRMLMHPYRRDLEGQNLSDFKDPRGVHIFTVFADKVRQDREGYVGYVWQWKDDPARLEAKESYIRLFEPWGWVIGTGLYIHDVVAEIHLLKLRLFYVMGSVIAVLILLLLIMLRGGMRADRLRAAAEMRLQESNERYLSLVRASAEGVLFVRNLRCVYANPVFLELAGCESSELPLLDWRELFPGVLELDPFFRDTGADLYWDALLRRRDGSALKCRIARKVMSENGLDGFVALVRRPEETGTRTAGMADGLLKRLLNLPSTAAEDIAREIALAETREHVVGLCRRVPELVGSMLESGASPASIAGMISSITDSATSRFIEMAQADLGSPPVDYAFVALGSQGRKEQTLFTDQDNAIIYEAPKNGSDERVERYFSALAASVCESMTCSGYRNCKGLVMASNPKWCQPLYVWKGYFTTWIAKAEAQDMMEFGAFFDLRCVKGERGLVQALRTHIQSELSRSPLFYTHAARTALLFKSPLRLFGNIVTSGSSTDRSGYLDLKAVMMPIVSFSRLYALHRNISFTSTQERLSTLSDLGVLLPSQHHDLLTAFETLLRLRLRHQAMTIQKGGEPDNLIDPAWLGHIDEAVLKECFREIDRIQEKINRDFLGGQTSL